MSSIKNDEKWNRALKSSGVIDAYENFYNKLKTRASTWKAGYNLIASEDYEIIKDVSKAEMKLYSEYLGKQVSSYTDDLNKAEQKDIESRLKETVENKNKAAYMSVKYIRNIFENKGNKEQQHDNLLNLYTDHVSKNQLAIHSEIQNKSGSSYNFSQSYEDEQEQYNNAKEDLKNNIKDNFGVNVGVLATGIGLSAVAKYANRSAQSDALQNGVTSSHASKEEERRSKRKRNMKLAFSVVASTVGAFVAIDGLMLKGRYTQSVLNSMTGKSDSIQR